MLIKKHTPSRFVLTGFSHAGGSRQFEFEGIDEDHVRTPFTVCADLALARAHGIHIQDLPLLCRGVLERRAVMEDARRLTFTEAEMRQHQVDRQAAQSAAAQKRRTPPRRPATPENTGNAWRLSPRNFQGGA